MTGDRQGEVWEGAVSPRGPDSPPGPAARPSRLAARLHALPPPAASPAGPATPPLTRDGRGTASPPKAPLRRARRLPPVGERATTPRPCLELAISACRLQAPVQARRVLAHRKVGSAPSRSIPASAVPSGPLHARPGPALPRQVRFLSAHAHLTQTRLAPARLTRARPAQACRSSRRGGPGRGDRAPQAHAMTDPLYPARLLRAYDGGQARKAVCLEPVRSIGARPVQSPRFHDHLGRSCPARACSTQAHPAQACPGAAGRAGAAERRRSAP